MRVSSAQGRARLRTRGGFTLIEVMVVALLLAIVGGTLMSVLSRQQRFYRGTADITELRSQLRQASAIMSNDLRGVSPIGTDIVAMTDSSIDFRYTMGTSIACKIPTLTTIILPPLTLTSGATLTSWATRPDAADSVYVYDERDTTNFADDAWNRFGIASLSDSTGACNAVYTQAADNASASYTLRLSASGPTLSSTVRQGVVVRFVRLAHYSLYRWTDGRWYLGYCTRQCNTSSTSMQPIAGPFNAYSAATPTTNGISLTYYDQTGATTNTPANVARISILLRGQSRQLINISGLARGAYTDSIRVDVAVRNRS